MSKQYKNVYTILEKAKKGELNTFYKEEGGLFGKLNFYKKGDLIKPYVHYIDQDKIDNIVESHLFNQQTIQEEYKLFRNSSGYRSMAEDKKPSFEAYLNKIKENYRKIPSHLKYDIFKLYYHKMDKLDFTERTDTNRTQFKFLENANNPVGKIMTETSNLKSSIFTRNMMLYYMLQLTEMEYVDPDDAQNIMNGLSGNSEFDDQQGQQSLDNMMKQNRSKNMLDRMMQDAQNTCKQLDDVMDQDIQEQIFDQENGSPEGKGAAKFSTDYFRTITAKISEINMSLGSLKEKIKKLLDRTNSYFSARKETTYEDLFNSDNIGGLDEYELLHPKLRKLTMEDVTIKDVKSVGKIDIYIDVSGSMCSECGATDKDGNKISKMNFAKSFAAKLKEMDMLNDVYVFDTKVAKRKNDIISIAMIDGSGGTNINKVVQHVNTVGNNALIITDAEDHCEEYSDKAFFIGVEGADFRGFSSVIKTYSENNQVVVFDGKKIYNVDLKGSVIIK